MLNLLGRSLALGRGLGQSSKSRGRRRIKSDRDSSEAGSIVKRGGSGVQPSWPWPPWADARPRMVTGCPSPPSLPRRSIGCSRALDRPSGAGHLAFRRPPGPPRPVRLRRLHGRAATPASAPPDRLPCPRPTTCPTRQERRSRRAAPPLGIHRRRTTRNARCRSSFRWAPTRRSRTSPIPRRTGSSASSPPTGATSTRSTRDSAPTPGDAKFVGLDVPEARARWVEPGEEWNKIGYYRVFGTQTPLRGGRRGARVEVKSLISWRGEWFVVHLSAIG